MQLLRLIALVTPIAVRTHAVKSRGIFPITEEFMQIATQERLRDLAVALPGSTRIFEKFGLDYCCGGAQSLADACGKARIAPQAVLAELEIVQADQAAQPNWVMSPVSALIEHILAKHHAFTRNELERLDRLMAKVRGVHSERHPELVKAEALLHAMKQELLQHMFKEERLLFPYVKELENAVEHDAVPPHAIFGTVRNPIQMMSLEHDTAGEMLRELRRVTNGYALPPDACASFRALYQGLQEFEADLHEHIHLENNLLFPRALALELEV
jgi:regulator of cell morphogenesis and NO signaling